MASDSFLTLAKVLAKNEIEKIPDILKKLENVCEFRYDEFASSEVLCNSTENIDKLLNDYPAFKAQEQIAELTVTQNESEILSHSKERDDLMHEMDHLKICVKNQNASIERLQADISLLKSNLESVNNEKQALIDLLSEMTFNEQSIGENGTDQAILSDETAMLDNELSRTVAELMSSRQENASNSAQFEIYLKEKNHEASIVNATVLELTEENRSLRKQCDDTISNLNRQLNESDNLANHYKTEMDAKTKLTEFYEETNNDCQMRINNLIIELKETEKQLIDATDQYRELETKLKEKEIQRQVDLEDKDKAISYLNNELRTVNDLFESIKTETVESILENFAPSVAAANRLLKGNSSLTELYNRYYDAIDLAQSNESKCIQLKMELEQVQLELQQQNPEFERQKIQYRELLWAKENLDKKVNDLLGEQDSRQNELDNIRSKYACLERENVRLNTTQSDLARQICHLLNEKQASQGANAEMSAIPTAKNLVTFNNVAEMQVNNQKLLVMVRELNTKMTEMQEAQNQADKQLYEERLSFYEKQLQDAEESRAANEELLTTCLKQKERFKELYYAAVNDLCKTSATQSMGGTDDDIPSGYETPPEVDNILRNKMKELKDLTTEYNDFRKESSDNFKLITDQLDAMQEKAKELIATNCQLAAQASVTKEKIKTQEKDIEIYKKQIQTLEDRNQMYDKIIAKNEMTIKELGCETLEAVKKASSIEIQCKHLQSECSKLVKTNNSLEVELKALHRQYMTHSILKNKLETITAASVRSQFQDQMQFEAANRQCSELHEKLEEEQTLHPMTREKGSQLHNELSITESQALLLLMQNYVLEKQWKIMKNTFKTWKANIISDLKLSPNNEINYTIQVEEFQIAVRLQLVGTHFKPTNFLTQNDIQNERNGPLSETSSKQKSENRQANQLSQASKEEMEIRNEMLDSSVEGNNDVIVKTEKSYRKRHPEFKCEKKLPQIKQTCLDQDFKRQLPDDEDNVSQASHSPFKKICGQSSLINTVEVSSSSTPSSGIGNNAGTTVGEDLNATKAVSRKRRAPYRQDEIQVKEGRKTSASNQMLADPKSRKKPRNGNLQAHRKSTRLSAQGRRSLSQE